MRRLGVVLIMSALASAATPGGALADDDGDDERDKKHDVTVLVDGTAQVGQVLDAVLSADEDAEGWDRATYSWYRCRSKKTQSCQNTTAPSAASYTIVDKDLGYRIRVLAARGDEGDDEHYVVSEPTAVVTAQPILVPAPVAPPPPPLPSPPPLAPVVAVDSVPAPPRMMSPAPTVRISGHLTRRGAMIERFSVRAPRGVTISVRCSGDGCPRRTLARAAAVTRLRVYERHLRAGIRLEIRVTLAGFIGKHTVIAIRRGKVPWRRDRCLFPGSDLPATCPGP